MYSAQIVGFELERDYLDDEEMETNYIDELAKETAGLSQG